MAGVTRCRGCGEWADWKQTVCVVVRKARKWMMIHEHYCRNCCNTLDPLSGIVEAYRA